MLYRKVTFGQAVCVTRTVEVTIFCISQIFLHWAVTSSSVLCCHSAHVSVICRCS